MKKRSMFIASFALVLLLVVGGTMAWFTDNAQVTNSFTAGTVDIDLIENGKIVGVVNGNDEVAFTGIEISNVNPGDTHDKEITVKSNGSKKTYVRIKLTPEWAFADEETSALLAPAKYLGLDSTKWILSDGYYYYHKILNTNNVTEALITGVEFIGEDMGNEYQGATFTLEVEVDAIQASHNAFESWGITALPAGVEEWTPVTP